jgi:hypothetical protein
MQSDERPDDLDDTERPRPGEEAVDARKEAPTGESQDEPSALPLQGVHAHHEREGTHPVHGDRGRRHRPSQAADVQRPEAALSTTTDCLGPLRALVIAGPSVPAARAPKRSTWRFFNPWAARRWNVAVHRGARGYAAVRLFELPRDRTRRPGCIRVPVPDGSVAARRSRTLMPRSAPPQATTSSRVSPTNFLSGNGTLWLQVGL